jgi:RNA polymerase sigma-70 factor (ECF subfamily)
MSGEPIAGFVQLMSININSIDDRARALLDLVAAGNQNAFEELYRLLSRRVYAFARRMIDSSEAADEVWRTAGRFRGDSRVTTWVLGIARNKALMAMRSNPKGVHEDIDEFAEVLDSDVPDAFASLAEKETQEIIRRCMQKLSEKHRECVHLTHFEDMSMPEVAAVLDIPEGTVKSRLSHARAQLAQCVSALLQRATA